MTKEDFGIPITKGKLLSKGEHGFVVSFYMGHLYLRTLFRAQLFSSNRQALTEIIAPHLRITDIFDYPLTPLAPEFAFAQKEDTAFVFVKSTKFQYSEDLRVVLWFARYPIPVKKRKDIVDVPPQAIPLMTAEVRKQYLLHVGRPVPKELEEEIKMETERLVRDGNIQNYYVADTFNLSESDIAKLAQEGTVDKARKNESQPIHSDPQKKSVDQHSEELPRSKSYGLFNVWTIVGTIVLAFAGLFFTLNHIVFAFVATALGISLYLAALHFELKEKYGKRTRAFSPILGLVCWIILIVLAWPFGDNKPTSSGQTKKSQDSVRVDTTLAHLPPNNSPTRDKSALKSDKQRNPKNTRQNELKTVPSTSVPQEQAPPILQLRFVTEPKPSTKQQFPYALRVVVQTNMTISPIHIQVIADGEIGDADFGFDTPSVMTNIQHGHSGNIFELFFETPPVTPGRPLVVILYSENKISVKSVVPIL